MRAIVTADAHLHPWRECSKDGGQDRLADGVDALRQTLAYAMGKKCDWVHLGDLKHLKGTWHDDVQNAILDLLAEFPHVEKTFLRGNHDGQPGRPKSGLQWLSRVENTTVIDEPCAFRITGVAWWPWQKSLDSLPAFLAEARKAKTRTLMAHAFLSGSVLGPGGHRVAGKGATLEQFGLAGKERVFDLGLFGDVPKGQVLGDTPVRKGARKLADSTKLQPDWVSQVDGQVWYPGNSYGKDWGEREEGKGCLFVDTEKGLVEKLPVQAPRFVVVDWKDVEVVKHEGWAKGDFVRVLVPRGVPERSIEKLRELSGARHFEVIRASAAPKAEQRATEIHAGLPQGEMLKRYVTARPAEGLAAVALLGAGLKLLEG